MYMTFNSGHFARSISNSSLPLEFGNEASVISMCTGFDECRAMLIAASLFSAANTEYP